MAGFDVRSSVDEYLSRADWRVNANANQGYSLGGLILNLSGKVIANYWLNHIYPPAISAAVVFSGGEPTMDPGLETAIREVRELGFQIGLHTGGTHPERLRRVLPLVDWVGLDIKAAAARYEALTRVRNSGGSAFQSLRALLQSGVCYEVRTTIHPRLHDEDEILSLARHLNRAGVTHYAVQVFRPTGCQDKTLNSLRFANFPGDELVAELEALFPSFTLRKH